jgi:transglutaminase-like putative cysteine protease
MRIAIDHTTRFHFAQAAEHGLLRLRLKPRNCAVQTVVDWSIDVTGGSLDAEYDDHNANSVAILRFAPGTEAITVTCRGLVDTIEGHHGVVGAHSGALPLWIFERETRATRPGPLLSALAAEIARGGAPDADSLDRLARRLGVLIEAGPDAGDAETALGVHLGSETERVHAFVAVARLLGIPARCVTGYVLAEGAPAAPAGADAPATTVHCWAEAHLDGTGWIAFDPSAADSGHRPDHRPDHRYVRVAVGVDASDAALITAHALGGGACDMAVRLAVARAQDRGQAAAH